jgi:Ca-activated chloride channel family protein
MKMQLDRAGRLRLFRALLIIAVLLIAATSVLGQSGRRKSPAQKSPSPIDATPARTSTTKAPQQPSAGSSAQKKEPTKDGDEVDSSDILHIASNLVPVPASVVDFKGYAVTDLKLEDFELRVDGQVKPLSDLSRSETPVRLVMLFDNSGSLDASRDLEKQAAMRFFRRVMRPLDQAAIYSVATENYLAQPLTNDVRRLEQTIDGFGKPEGATSLFDAIVDAVVYLHPYHGRKVIVIVSDGADTTSRTDFETAVQRALAEDCQVYVVQTGHYDDANRRDLAAERRMEQLTAQTGGAVYVPKETSDLEAAFVQIAADLAHQYVLSYYATDERRDGQYHTIALRVKTRRDARVRARRGFYAPRA